MIPSILLVGGGRMGAALLAGWREQGLAPSVVVDPAPDATALADDVVRVVPNAAALPADFMPRIVVLAIKPQMAVDVLPAYAHLAANAAFLSIMAGRSLAGLASLLGARAAIVRAMPNTPAAIRQGVTVACAAPGVAADTRALCDTLLRAVGQVAWIEDEAQMDAVTAVSGSGPAYVFLLAELLEQAACAEGLPPDLARTLARATVAGAGALLGASAEDSAALRQAVTSKGGTTEAALAVLMADDAWPASLARAVRAAAVRSRGLAK